MLKTIAVPKGIGDVSWLISKLCNQPDDINLIVPEGYPERTLPFLKLVPSIKKASENGKHDFGDIRLMRFSRPYVTWQDVLNEYGEQMIYLECNDHLLAGKPLANFLPDLKTNFHYQINTMPEHSNKAETLLSGTKGKFALGIHTASIAGIKAWNAWMPKDWTEFIGLCKKENPDILPIFLGGLWDTDATIETVNRIGKETPCIDLTGKTDIGTLIEVLKRLDYYVGFSCGINVFLNVINRPCAALWPDWQNTLKYSWADPETIEKREYRGFVYDEVERIFYRVKDKLNHGT